MVVGRGDTVRVAIRVSTAARGLATLDAGAQGRVDGVYRSAINVATPGGLLTLASPEAGALPNAILLDLGGDWRALDVEPGMAVVSEGGVLRIAAAGVSIPWTQAVRWSPRMQEPRGGAGGAVTHWRRRSGGGRSIGRRAGSGRGFAPLLDGGLGATAPTPGRAAGGFGGGIRAAARWCARDDVADPGARAWLPRRADGGAPPR